MNRMPKPAKTSDKCSLKIIPDVESGAGNIKMISLFEQRRIKGFWPCFNDEKGERELTVSKLTLVCVTAGPYNF